jgi:hypothetical protein
MLHQLKVNTDLFGFLAGNTKKSGRMAKCNSQSCQKPDMRIQKTTADLQLVTVASSLLRQHRAKSIVILLYSFDALHKKKSSLLK